MAQNSMQALKERFKTAASTNSGQNNYYPFYKIPDNSTASVRFLRDLNEENPLGFLLEKVTHQLRINGETKTVPCFSQWGEDCPICKVAKEYYDAGDKANGSLYYKKRSYIAQALIGEDPIIDKAHENAEGKVKLLNIGYSLFKIIKDTFEGGELDEVPYSYAEGTNFNIKRSKQGDFASYTLSKFARKSTSIANQEEYVESQLVDLSTLLPKKPDMAMIEGLLEAALTGRRVADDSGDEDDGGAMARMAGGFKGRQAAQEEAPARKPAARAPAVSDDEDDDAEAAALLAELKAKRLAAQQ